MLNKQDSEFNRKAFELGAKISSKFFGFIGKKIKFIIKHIFLGFTGLGSMLIGIVIGATGTKNEEEERFGV